MHRWLQFENSTTRFVGYHAVCWLQAIIWINAGILLTGFLRTNFRQWIVFLSKLKYFHRQICIWKWHLLRWQPSCSGLNVLSIMSVKHNILALGLRQCLAHGLHGDELPPPHAPSVLPKLFMAPDHMAILRIFGQVTHTIPIWWEVFYTPAQQSWLGGILESSCPPKAACQFAADDILLYEFCYYNPMD